MWLLHTYKLSHDAPTIVLRLTPQCLTICLMTDYMFIHTYVRTYVSIILRMYVCIHVNRSV